MTSIKNENWFLIENKLLFAFNEPDSKYINLTSICGEDMRYHKLDHKLVDYPGEYDIDWVIIYCFLGRWEKLSYLIVLDDQKIAIVQTPDVLENNTDLLVAQTWLYTDDSVLQKFEQLELEWEKIKLEQEIV